MNNGNCDGVLLVGARSGYTDLPEFWSACLDDDDRENVLRISKEDITFELRLRNQNASECMFGDSELTTVKQLFSNALFATRGLILASELDEICKNRSIVICAIAVLERRLVNIRSVGRVWTELGLVMSVILWAHSTSYMYALTCCLCVFFAITLRTHFLSRIRRIVYVNVIVFYDASLVSPRWAPFIHATIIMAWTESSPVSWLATVLVTVGVGTRFRLGTDYSRTLKRSAIILFPIANIAFCFHMLKSDQPWLALGLVGTLNSSVIVEVLKLAAYCSKILGAILSDIVYICRRKQYIRLLLPALLVHHILRFGFPRTTLWLGIYVYVVGVVATVCAPSAIFDYCANFLHTHALLITAASLHVVNLTHATIVILLDSPTFIITWLKLVACTPTSPPPGVSPTKFRPLSHT